MRIIADVDKCIGAGQCLFTEPELFDQNEHDGTVVVLNAEPGSELLEQKAREASYVCPGRAISLVE
ncbi:MULTISPECIES: ferredoxin [unclassified Streptomyces]|uniref:ferredoxin n=1 Tax=unclassified Streptomyces TaxID=2593676 RepID=UPI0022560EE9|nr:MULTISPECIES: ferredoxin [unclassified Streptomyces]MCX5150040.1 ferredoxin [Streptomyces sp. NBC_00320]WSN48252.1 ferredoxin [Streptomyces sp. NBC_01296]WSW62333.1 ferredoxin [Streptomyces sp. NBC_00998]